MKQKLFSITKKDFRIEYYRGSGKGGQKRNKTSSACRITHIASNAVGKCEDQRSQEQNKKIAFKRLLESDKFRKWLRFEIAVRDQGFRDVESKIKDLMKEDNLLVETGNIDRKGRFSAN